jgi:hypothetical protein
LVLRRRPQTPCALRLREPDHPFTTSDAPRHTPVRRAGSPFSRDRDSLARLSSGQSAVPRRARARFRPRRFRTRAHPAQDAFHRIEFESCDPSRQVRKHQRLEDALLTSHPFACRDVARLVEDRATASRYPARSWACLSAHPFTKRRRCVSPTSATADSRHEHLLERSDSRGEEKRYSRPPSRPLEPKPHRTTRVAALVDVALPASASSTTRTSSF